MTQAHQRATTNGLGIDRAEAERFLGHIGRGDVRFTFQTFDDSKARREARAERNKVHKQRGEEEEKDPFARIFHGTLDQHLAELTHLNEQGAGVFVMINAGDFRGRSEENVTKVRALFVDRDDRTKPRPTDGRVPHLVIESSARGEHEYFIVDGCKLDDFTGRQKGLIALYDSDRSVHDLPRVMRLPGFFHRKGEPHLVRIVAVNDLPPYAAADFPSAAEEPHQPSSGDPTADPARVAAATAVIPNDHEPLKGYAVPSKGEPRRNDDWDTWCNLGFAIFRAVGDDVGRPLFNAWSAKSPKHSDAGTLQKWKDITDYPPNKITAASIFYRANLENPRWPALMGNSIEAAIEINDLSLLPVTQYDQKRKDAAKRLGMRVGTLDGIVEQLRSGSGGDADVDKQGQEISFKPPEPWPDPVDGAALVEEMIAAHKRHVVMSDEYALAVALWEIHTYVIDAAEHSPRLQIRSAAYRCGKTTLLQVIKAIVSKPIATESISMAALFRVIELCQPTILLDEAEATLKREGGGDNEDMRMIVNAGHRRGGGVIRTVGDDFEPRLFGVFCPMVFCWLVRRGEQVAQTIADRSITVELRRRLKGEEITRLRSNRVGHLSTLGRRAARWVADNIAALKDADPALPEELNDRAQDNWRPLIAIADAMSKAIGERARAAAKVMSAEAAIADDDASLLALADADAIFKLKEVIALRSEDLVQAFIELQDRPWATWRKGSGNGREPMTKHSLARLLKPYGIRPRMIRFGRR
jgi:putative DNA primase/helicase